MKTISIPNETEHIGRKVETLRILTGLTQTALGQKLGGISKQAVSKLERSSKIGPKKLSEISYALGFTSESIINFKEANIVFLIENIRDQATAYPHFCQYNINPLGKVVELYERLLDLEREKVALMQKMLEGKLEAQSNDSIVEGSYRKS